MGSQANGAAPPARRASRLVFVELGECDRPALEQHLARLGPTDRIRRFQRPVSNASLGLYVGRIDFEHTLMIGALHLPATFVGVAEARFERGPAPTASIEVSVDASHRGGGLARHLIGLVVEEAFARGAQALVFRFDLGARAGLRLGRAFGAQVDLRAGHALLSRPVVQTGAQAA